MIPLTINGIGIKEGLLVYFLQWAQVAASYSISLGILYRFVFLVLAVIGGIMFAWRRYRLSRRPQSLGPDAP